MSACSGQPVYAHYDCEWEVHLGMLKKVACLRTKYFCRKEAGRPEDTRGMVARHRRIMVYQS